ncbi:hypothetical protein J7I93_02760 [Bacillus sp. ISL-47]|uniref:hypothetical protein n=1 Tax=Bacillus sp. ISL-47 TaxID=2819130 RepID=UPI001BE83BBA|nr:hypothetical protein [Bacillus sp. ISL-47]MBT2687099.1 hypothetical protein [Bacillus sp. ISL-47]MBT2711086.1 hypothetical protein [Pseudomonas sp. ISL-84]
MRLIYLAMFFLFIPILLWGCQDSRVDSTSKDTKAEDKNYDVSGIITEVSEEHSRVLVNLTKKVQEQEDQMWITVEDGTKMINQNGGTVSFKDLKLQVHLKANLRKECLEPNPRICFAKEMIIE